MAHSRKPLAIAAVWLLVLTGWLSAQERGAETFDRTIAPILIKHCLGCHNASELQGNLDLTTSVGILKGGDTGPAIVPGMPDQSLLLDRITSGEMPPEEEGKPLSEVEVAAVKAWIAAGSQWPEGRTLSAYEATTEKRAGLDWWSLQPVVRPQVPQLANQDWASNPIDAFVLAKLEASGLSPAPPADKRTLIRRLYFDLIGLPPSAEEVEAFERDQSLGAYEQLVDRLLASPHFGERWARHWLDVVRFAETCGYERDQPRPHAWKYRDWVVESINQDKPYDRFVLEQLAGDELPDRTPQTIAATGFIRLGTWNDEPNDPAEYRFERLEDMVHATSTAFLGMTVKCARCHDHKFDPIRQTDYYRMAAVFWAGPIEPGERDLLGGPTAEQLPGDVFGWTDRGRTVPDFHLLRKGDPHQPQQVIEPGYLSMVAGLDRPMSPPPEDAATTRRRLQLAQWIVDPKNPLTARVMVNRLWQHYFGEGLVRTPDNFGFNGDRPTHPELLDYLASEIVQGGWRAKPLHKLILMSSTYRQSSVHPQHEQYAERDFDNRLLWRASRRRLEAEALRDSMLTVSGQLDWRIGGPSFYPDMSRDVLEGLSMKGGDWKPSPPEQQRRRSLYMFSKRSLLSPLMTAFDFSDTTQPCAQRDVTTVAPQALALLNNDFVHDVSRALAERVRSQSGDDPVQQVSAAWRLGLSREPSEAERSAAMEHLTLQAKHFAEQNSAVSGGSPDDLALVSLCHALLNTNEFIYVD